MPIEIERIEERIYCSHYIGHVTVAEIMGGIVERQAVEAGETPYILILDMSELTQMDFDLLQLRDADQTYSMAATLVVKVPIWLEGVIKVLKQNSAMRLEVYDSREQALERARAIRDETPQS